MSRRIECNAGVISLQRLAELQGAGRAAKTSLVHQFLSVGCAEYLTLAAARHMVGVCVRDKGMLRSLAAVVKSDMEIRQHNTLMAGFGNIHKWVIIVGESGVNLKTFCRYFLETYTARSTTI